MLYWFLTRKLNLTRGYILNVNLSVVENGGGWGVNLHHRFGLEMNPVDSTLAGVSMCHTHSSISCPNTRRIPLSAFAMSLALLKTWAKSTLMICKRKLRLGKKKFLLNQWYS